MARFNPLASPFKKSQKEVSDSTSGAVAKKQHEKDCVKT
jgi:hypothetical protein